MNLVLWSSIAAVSLISSSHPHILTPSQEVLTVDYVLESLRSIEQELKEKNKTYNQLNECLEKTNEVGT